jgi:protein-disulfide isomerase
MPLKLPSASIQKVLAAAAIVAAFTVACNSLGSPAPTPSAEPEPPIIVEFGDFQCPHCARFALKTLPALRRDVLSTGIARFEYRHYAFLGPESTLAAETSECARDQGRFDAYYDGVYNLLVTREGISSGSLRKVAEGLGLDMAGYEACTRSRTHREKVESDKEYGRRLGVRGTPSLYINGEKLDWYSYRNLLDQIRDHAGPAIPGKDSS